MSDFRFNCPHCQQSLEAPEEMLGGMIECPKCTRTITIPSPTLPNTADQGAVSRKQSVVQSRAASSRHAPSPDQKDKIRIFGRTGLFDFSFKHFITPSLIRGLYIFYFIAGTIVSAFFIISAFAMMVSDSELGFARFVVSPLLVLIVLIGFIVFLVVVRTALEFVIVVFNIEHHTKASHKEDVPE